MNKKLTSYSFDNVEDRISMLKALFPEAVHEGRLDYDTFMTLIGDEFDNDTEKYRFEWKGKQASLQVAQKQSTATLRPVIEESKNWESTNNLYIEGDNLEVMKLLQRAYLGKVKMIYIDPPYNTGNDFVYKDNFKEPLEGYREATEQVNKANPETAGRYHSNWLSMMYPRLLIARTLLREDGVIFISIDDNEVHNLRRLCDEVFGENNFIAQVVWERAYSPVNLKKHFSESHDYIICYAKRNEILSCNGLQRSEEANARYANPDNDPRGVWQSDNLSVGPAIEKNIYKIKTPSGREVYPPSGYSWRFSQEKLQELIADNRIWFGEDGSNSPRLKRFLSEVKDSVTPMTIWKYTEVGHSQSAKQKLKDLFLGKSFFDYPKSVELIKRMLELYTDKDSLILDFFSGSSTTAHAVMQLNAEDGGNRQFMMIQLPEATDEKSEAYKAGYKTIADIGKERIRRAGEKILAEYPDKADSLDIGFNVFKLDSTNLTKWDSDFSNIKEEDKVKEIQRRLQQSIEELKPDRSELDLLYEVMLKYGLPLTEPIVKYKVQGKKFYAIGAEEYLFVCLDSGITREVIVSFVQEYTSGAVMFSDNCFSNDSDIINVEDVLNRAKIDFMWI